MKQLDFRKETIILGMKQRLEEMQLPECGERRKGNQSIAFEMFTTTNLGKQIVN